MPNARHPGARLAKAVGMRTRPLTRTSFVVVRCLSWIGASTGAATTRPKTVQAFSARLRDEIDLDMLAAELLAVVDQMMEPTQASLWLRPPKAPAQPQAATSRQGQPSPTTVA